MSAEIVQAEYDVLETIAGRFGQWSEVNQELDSRIANVVSALE